MKILLFIIVTISSYSCFPMELPGDVFKEKAAANISREEAAAIAQMNNELKLFKKSKKSEYQEYCRMKLEFAAQHNYPVLVDKIITLLENCGPYSSKVPKNIMKGAFLIAVQNGNIPLVNRFLQARKDIIREGLYLNSEKPEMGSIHALEIAAEKGNLGLAQVLLQASADPNRANRNACEARPLLHAADTNDVQAIRVLLAVGAEPDLMGSHRYRSDGPIIESNALMVAAVRRNYYAIEALLEGVEYPPSLLTNLFVALHAEKTKPTYFSLLPADTLPYFSQYLKQHFKIQADPTIKSGYCRPIDTLMGLHFMTKSEKEDEIIALLESKMNTKADKPAITPMELYKLSIQ